MATRPAARNSCRSASDVLSLCSLGSAAHISVLFTWVLGWGIGGSLIDSGLINAGVYPLEGGQLGTAGTFICWSLLWGGGGVWLYRRWTRSAATGGDTQPKQ